MDGPPKNHAIPCLKAEIQLGGRQVLTQRGVSVILCFLDIKLRTGFHTCTGEPDLKATGSLTCRDREQLRACMLESLRGPGGEAWCPKQTHRGWFVWFKNVRI